MKVFTSVLKQNNENVPIWLLRQAGRYMPEYMEVRNKAGSFLNLCYNPSMASQVTMQPIERYDLDSAILFSDILIIPDSIGWPVEFKPSIGPTFAKLMPEDITKLSSHFDFDKVGAVYQATKKIRNTLDKSKSLIGFTGSPWTVASYMIEGRGKHDFSYSKSLLYDNPKFAERLIDILVKFTIEHLLGQINNGADTIMLFDSWAGMLSEYEYEKYVIEPTIAIVKSIKQKHPTVPIIGFPRGSGFNYNTFIEKTKIDIISVDQFVPLEVMASWQDKIVVQGNLDPVCLLSDEKVIAQKVDLIFSIMKKRNFIFNIGHGILPNTNPKKVEFLVKYIRENYAKI